MYVAGITKELLGYEKASDAANGHWNKGFITTRLVQWLENVLPRMWPDTTDQLQQVIVSGWHHEHQFPNYILIYI